jgi:N4-gp56 family major capsid protein
MAYTTTGTVDYVQTAYDMLAYYALRPELYFDQVADIKPTNQSMAGSSVVFNVQNDLALATTSLNESTDITPVALTSSQVTLTLAEYGGGTITTADVRAQSFVSIDEVQANAVGYWAGRTVDEVAKIQLQGGSNVNYSAGPGVTAGTAGQPPTARNQITPLDTMRAYDIRYNVAALKRNNVPGYGGYYLTFIHPDVSFDLWQESGNQALIAPHIYSAPEEVFRGEIGAFAGARFIETPTAPLFADAGSSTTDTDVYGTLFLGRQALAKVWAMKDGNGPHPVIVMGPITDYLRRFQPLGFKWMGAYGVFRSASIWRQESASSIGQNTTAGVDTPTEDL